MSTGDVSPSVQILYRENHGWLQGWLRRRLGNSFDAADLAHDTFVRILSSGRTPDASQSRAHLTQIAKGLVIDLHRRRIVESAYLDAVACLPDHLAPSPEERALALEVLLLLDTALDRLPAKVREVFLLSQLDGLTYAEIAKRLDMSVGAIRKYMLRAALACHGALHPASPCAQPGALQNSCAAVSPSVLHEALEWQVTFWSGEVMDEERDGFDKWLARSPEHAHAWSQVQKTDEQFVPLARPAASIALRAASPASLPERTPRRAVLGIAGLLDGTGCAAYMARNTWQWQQIVADIGTGRGERKEVTLADGTRIILGSASAIDVRYDAHQRQLRLRGGQVFITTGADTQANPSGSKRPFIVLTEHGSVRAIGTRFAVRDAGAWAEVAVEQGAVEITPKNQSAGVPRRVNAGERASFRDAGADPVQPLDANATAWIRGLLVAERMRLEDLLAKLGRHRSGVIRCDPAVRDLVVSGVYSLDDTDHALQILTQALPVQLTSVTRWWVIVGPRS